MNRDEFLTALQDIFQRDEECSGEDQLDDYEEWDSLSKMSLMAYFDIDLGIKLSLKDLQDVKTVNDLIGLAGNKIL